MDVAREGPREGPIHPLTHPTALGTRDSLWEDLQPLLAGHFGHLLPRGEGGGSRNRGLRDKRHCPGQLSQCLKSGFLKAEPRMGTVPCSIEGHSGERGWGEQDRRKS